MYFLIIFRYIYIPSRHFPSTPSSSDGACHTHPWWNHNFLARKSSWKCLLLWWQGTSMFYLPGVLFDCLCWWGELFCDWRPGPIFRDTNSQWVAQKQLEARPRVTEKGEGGARPVITHPISCIYHFCLEIFVCIIMNEKLNSFGFFQVHFIFFIMYDISIKTRLGVNKGKPWKWMRINFGSGYRGPILMTNQGLMTDIYSLKVMEFRP